MKLQFRLRTLMITVTLLALPLGYVGWQAKIVRERKAFRDSQSGKWSEGDGSNGGLSWLRRQLGDEPVAIVGLPIDSSKELRAQAAALFPEARIMAVNPRFGDFTLIGATFISEDEQWVTFPDEPKPPPRTSPGVEMLERLMRDSRSEH